MTGIELSRDGGDVETGVGGVAVSVATSVRDVTVLVNTGTLGQSV